ncbi:SpoIIE family protein phosphatase [Kitasatospora sp. MMS16-BH015]|uniref:SpoIIE family protein phosphatase n=1 Tax=Kitasatospora sp. MMS16-BH015 TaxID=2018025 RepID=UPI0026D7842B
MLYTDGLVEGHRGPGSAHLGTDGMLERLAAGRADGTSAVLDELIGTARRLNAGRHADDLAILHLAWNRAGDGSAL